MKITRTTILFLFVFSCFFPLLLSAGEGEEIITTQLYTAAYAEKDTIRLEPLISLIPPGSSMEHKNINFEQLIDLQSEDILKSAQVDIDFFQARLQEDVKKEVSILDAFFDVYRDMMGNFHTDPRVLLFVADH